MTEAGGKKLLTRTRPQDDRAKLSPRRGGGLARTAPAIWGGSREARGSAHRRGRPGFSRGKMQAGDCILRPWEGTDFCQGGPARPSGNLGVEWLNGSLFLAAG